MTIEAHLSKIERGLKFFNSLLSLCYLAIIVVVIRMGAQFWDASSHDSEGVFWTVLMGISIGLIAALPYAFLALGLRHVRNLFGAVRDAISELQTTV